MPRQFTHFVVFAQMRTGSNFLESNLNCFDDIDCKGEAFNANFIGYPNSTELFGLTVADRDADPLKLLQAFSSEQGPIQGFRYFHDHDPRVLNAILDDPKCAKIILYRNPIESFVSLEIAIATDQWKLTNATRRQEKTIKFRADKFDQFLTTFQGFYHSLNAQLQARGQTGFHVHYDDLHNLDVINGIGRYLGVSQTLTDLSKNLKPQNPESLEQKVSNFEEMFLHLANLDYFGLAKIPSFEPSQRGSIPTLLAAAETPIL